MRGNYRNWNARIFTTIGILNLSLEMVFYLKLYISKSTLAQLFHLNIVCTCIHWMYLCTQRLTSRCMPHVRAPTCVSEKIFVSHHMTWHFSAGISAVYWSLLKWKSSVSDVTFLFLGIKLMLADVNLIGNILLEINKN